MAEPESIRAAMKRFMDANEPNSGHRPPNLTITPSENRCCLTCLHWNGRGKCRLYEYRTPPNAVSDSWQPRPT